ncbi:MAG TPA: hypothetical protein VFR64_21005 [Methylomirabilota bacterium]|jgi:hypothetical protein|nr:hypothetical protein [Methylomirabilota bacterium]
MRLTIIAAIVALIIGFSAGYLMWGERSQQAAADLDALKMRQAQQADELRKVKEELTTEREQRQSLEAVISQGRK